MQARGCIVLLSEDMSHECQVGDVTILNLWR